MDNNLNSPSIFFDENNKFRILNPDSTKITKNLVEQCDQFIQATKEFGKIVDEFIELFSNIVIEIDKNRTKAFGTKNLLNSFEREKEMKIKQVYSEIIRKQAILEELKMEHQSLKNEELEQENFLAQITFQK